MSDARFASVKTDPRFRRPKKHRSKVVIDDRFKDLLGDEEKGKGGKKKQKKTPARVDKYGRVVSEMQEKDSLRRFYRLETDGDEEEVPVVDYARGAVLMESSDEEEQDGRASLADEGDSDNDQDGFVSLGADPKKWEDDNDEDFEIDLDENTIATLDAQVAEYAETIPGQEGTGDVKQTRRLAVVNLDWDHVRAVHLYKIFSSLLSPTAPLASAAASSREKKSDSANQSGMNMARGRILSVRVYPSEFGKMRMAKEEKEGPPTEVFKKKKDQKLEDEEINEKTIIETGSEADYDENALRKYQLERLRYYYAIIECDTVQAASHVYNELEGTELERSANVFDLSFVPDDMTFEDEPRDEATEPSNTPYRAVEFTTDALRHSKVKLTWDEDDPERTHILRRPLSKKEVEEADFRAYIASSSSEGSDDECALDSKPGKRKSKNEATSSKKSERDKLRALLLGRNDDALPEGWGNAFDDKTIRKKKRKVGGQEDSDVDMEVTFTPGLSETKDPEEETTLDKYRRKMKEKKKKKKQDEAKMKGKDDDHDASTKTKSSLDDEFFGAESDSHRGDEKENPDQSSKIPTKQKKVAESSKAELALLATSDNPYGEPTHFDMKAVLKAEKQRKNKSKHKSKKHGGDDKADDGPGETQDDFVINVKDDRFVAVHEDHQFAIDPTHPQYKKTKSMAALLDERSKRQKSNPRSDRPTPSHGPVQQNSRSLQSLAESVKRKSAAFDQNGLGKRRRLGKS